MSAARAPRRKLVLVTWDDAWHVVDYDPSPDDARYRVRTVGWLLARTATHLLIAAEVLPCGRPRGVTRIPRAVVLRVQTLRTCAKRA